MTEKSSGNRDKSVTREVLPDISGEQREDLIFQNGMWKVPIVMGTVGFVVDSVPIKHAAVNMIAAIEDYIENGTPFDVSMRTTSVFSPKNRPSKNTPFKTEKPSVKEAPRLKQRQVEKADHPFASMSRLELQAEAKKWGLSANRSSADLIHDLIELAEGRRVCLQHYKMSRRETR